MAYPSLSDIRRFSAATTTRALDLGLPGKIAVNATIGGQGLRTAAIAGARGGAAQLAGSALGLGAPGRFLADVTIGGAGVQGAFAKILVFDVLGLDRVLKSLFGYAFRLGIDTKRLDERAAQTMADRMRGDVHRASGRLFNGIEWYRDGNEMVVKAEAVRTTTSGKRSVDYAPFVERGTRAGVRGRRISYVADANYFDLGAGRRNTYSRTRRQYRMHPGTQAQPFYWDNVVEVLRERGHKQQAAAIEAGRAEGLDVGSIPAAA